MLIVNFRIYSTLNFELIFSSVIFNFFSNFRIILLNKTSIVTISVAKNNKENFSLEIYTSDYNEIFSVFNSLNRKNTLFITVMSKIQPCQEKRKRKKTTCKTLVFDLNIIIIIDKLLLLNYSFAI